MTMLLLSIHITLALITVVATAAVAAAAYQRKSAIERLLTSMWLSFIGVAISGLGLVVLAPQSLGHACAVMTAFVVLTAGAQLYYSRTVRI